MTKRIFRAIFVTALAVIVASVVLIMGLLNSYFDEMLTQDLKNELVLLSEGVEKHGMEYLDNLDPENFHLTWLSKNGDVLYDTHTLIEGSQEDPIDKEKAFEALSNADGKSLRYTTAFTEKYIYCATELEDGTILCASVSEMTSVNLVWGMSPYFLILIQVIMLISWYMADSMTEKIMEPLNNLNLDNPFANEMYEEIEPLISRIQQQNRTLRKNAKKFERTISNMQEGLVLLDKDGKILNMNPAAAGFLGAKALCAGCLFQEVGEGRFLQYALENAMVSGHEEVRSSREGRVIQFDISRIEVEDEMEGVVILIFDVTERDAAERRRKEFTANVSHELKTPLQGIIGSAELIENQMVETEDIPRFIGHVKMEAQRLLVMIQDIIGLSQLDEAKELPKEMVSLFSLANEVAAILEPVAAMNNISLEVHGDKGDVYGVRKLLYDIIYNLCDNAIKYNVKDGAVQIEIQDNGSEVLLNVRDTGVGIAPEHTSRVFERFYRVDKSHSKKTGGTGLGLAIVKHAVEYHFGKISVLSKVGAGTEIQVILKKMF